MDLLGLLVTVIVLGLVFYLLYWLVGQIPLPDVASGNRPEYPK